MSSAAQDSRVRFLRACDRCRKRKMRCDNNIPCLKCEASGTECSFSMPETNRISSTASASVEPPAREDASLGSQRKRSRRSGSAVTRSDASSERPKILDPSNTSHFFIAQDGLARYAGSTSGWPILDAARRQQKARDELKRPASGPEPDWEYLSSMLTTSESRLGSPDIDEEELDYFPGQAHVPNEVVDAQSLVASFIPSDLLASLIAIYFETIHPRWPIIHPTLFYEALDSWTEPSFAALIVAMCMVASRYTDDIRVRADPANPASAGVTYFRLFTQLRDQAVNHDDALLSVQATLLAAMFNCVDNVPHALAQSLLASAIARAVDGGLHRSTSNIGLGDSIDREIRARTAWACYAWDKRISAICGRLPMVPINDFDVQLPAAFEPTDGDSDLLADDQRQVAIFRQFILATAVLEETFYACSHPPDYTGVDLLDKIVAATRAQASDSDKLGLVSDHLAQFRRELPEGFRKESMHEYMRSPLDSPILEHVATTEYTVELLIASRKMQLAFHEPSANNNGALERARGEVISAAKNIVNLGVHLGSLRLFPQAGIVFAYTMLLAGRLLLAALLSARSASARQQTTDATAAAKVVAVVLRHVASTLPIAQGSAEVYEETCRVCRVQLPSAGSPLPGTRKYAWHRPINYRNPAPRHNSHSPGNPTLVTPNTAFCQASGDLVTFPALSSNIDPVLDHFEGTNLSNPYLDFSSITHTQAGVPQEDFAWFLLGGDASSDPRPSFG